MGSISIKCEPAVVSEAIAEVCWRMSSHIRIADNAQKKKKKSTKEIYCADFTAKAIRLYMPRNLSMIATVCVVAAQRLFSHVNNSFFPQ